MKMKLLFAAAAMTLLTACNQEEIATDPAAGRVPVTLSYTTVDATETRAATNLNQGTFASGEAVMVLISNTGLNTWTDYAFTTAAEGAMTAPAPAPYYPAGDQNIDIVAYYPATAGTSFTVATDQTADADYKASDLMFASVTNQAKQAAAVELAFSHKMAKLCVNITAGQGVTSITGVSILNVKPTVSFDQAAGTVGDASGTATRIAMSNNGAALIPAQTIEGNLLSIVTDKGTATYSVSSKTFEAGYLYTLNITVNLREVGTSTAITNWNAGGTSTDDADINPVTTAMTTAGLEAVDMGHPGGVKWANMNVGATTVTGYGDYFAWGETTPKSDYSWATYKFDNSDNHDGSSFSKYTGSDYSTLQPEDDAARQNWGGGWRTPTDAEWTWLRYNCTWTWQTDYNGSGINGLLVCSNIDGYTNNTIFLPAAGYRSNANLEYDGSYGYYWSSSLDESNSDRAWHFFFNSVGVLLGNGIRSLGRTIRPVME